MTIATYTLTESSATSIAREVRIGVRAKAGSSKPSQAADWKGGAFPTMVFSLPVGATTATATIETAGNSAVDGNREFEFYEVSRTPSTGTLTMQLTSGTITDDDTGPAPIVINPAGWDAEDNFDNGPTDLAARPNWSVTDGPFRIANSGVVMDARGGAPWAAASFGPKNLVDNFELEIDGAAGEPGVVEFRYSLWQATPPDTSNFGDQLIDLGIASNGAALGGALVLAPVDRPAFSSTDTMRLRCVRGVISLMVRGEWMTYRQNYYGSTVDPDKRTEGVIARADTDQLGGSNKLRTGRFGLWRWRSDSRPILNGIRTRDVRFAIEHNDRFVSRRAVGATSGDCYADGFVSGSPVRWVYRFEAVDGTVRQDWREFSPTITGDKWSGVFGIPFGHMGLIRAGYIDASGNFWGDVSRRVSCGIAVLYAGQSNAENRGGGWPVVDVPGYGRNDHVTSYPVLNFAFDPARVHVGNRSLEYQLTTNAVLGAMIATDKMAVPVAFLVTGFPGAGISGILDTPNGGGYYPDKVYPMIAGVRGIIDVMVWDQGESDTNDENPPTYYAESLREAYNRVKVAGKNPGLPLLLTPPGRINEVSPDQNYGDTTWTQQDINRQVLREQMLQLVNDSSLTAQFSASKLGIPMSDDAHYSIDGIRMNCKRDAYSVARILGINTPDGRGPLLTGATRSGATITLAVDLNGAASLSGFRLAETGKRNDKELANTFKAFQVTANNFTSLLPVSNIAVVDGNKVVITLASAPSGPVKIRYAYGASYEDRELIWGTGYADGRDDIPIFPIYVPLTSN